MSNTDETKRKNRLHAQTVGVNGLPREGDTYKTFHSGIYSSRKQGGPFYNISVTVDRHCLGILERQSKGSRSEYIRWAIKDFHLRGHESQSRVISELEGAIQNHLKIQKKLISRIEELENSKPKSTGIRKIFGFFFRSRS